MEQTYLFQSCSWLHSNGQNKFLSAKGKTESLTPLMTVLVVSTGGNRSNTEISFRNCVVTFLLDLRKQLTTRNLHVSTQKQARCYHDLHHCMFLRPFFLCSFSLKCFTHC